MPGLLLPTLPPTQTAIIQGGNGTLVVQDGLYLPPLPKDRILIRVSHVALNPCDWKMPDRFPTPGCLDGCDFSGTVVALGSAVTGFSIGDEVCGAVHGSNPIDKATGAFAEYVAADAELIWKVPKSVPMQEACALGSGVVLHTLGLVLNSLRQKDALGRIPPLKGDFENPVPEEEAKELLVYAGSTAVGTALIQLLRLMGHKPLAVCSPKNFKLIEGFGAVKCFDYHSPTCASSIRTYTRNTLAYAIDPMVTVKTAQLCHDALGRAGGRYIALEAYSDDFLTRKVVKAELVLGMKVFGRKIALDYGYGADADPESRKVGVEWTRSVQRLMDEGRLKVHPVRVLDGRWEAVLEGLGMLRKHEVSGEKLVVRIGEE